MRVVTVCFAGKPVTAVQQNYDRIEIFRSVSAIINQQKWIPQIILFPGGFFHLPQHVGPMNHDDRVEMLSRQSFSTACVEVAFELEATIIVGVDSIKERQYAADQLCVSWNSQGITGIGRKIFPAPCEKNRFVVYAQDIVSKMRLAPLGNDKTALLCSCYDMFGCTENKATGPRGRYIRLFDIGNNEPLNREIDKNYVITAINENLRSWRELVNQSSISLATIHFFGRGNRTSYWQRHGLQKASSVLNVNGGIAFGSAHFEKLPHQQNVCVLAARNGDRLNSNEFIRLDNALVRRYDVSL